jgi:hypothetical protein
MTKSVLSIVVVMLSALGSAQTDARGSDASDGMNSKSSFVTSMLRERHDSRFPFHGSVTNLQSAERGSQILLIKAGVLERAELVSIQECRTFDDVLRRCGFSRIPTQPQIRVVQKNRILQSGFERDTQERKELQAIKLEGGDVVIVARKEL